MRSLISAVHYNRIYSTSTNKTHCCLGWMGPVRSGHQPPLCPHLRHLRTLGLLAGWGGRGGGQGEVSGQWRSNALQCSPMSDDIVRAGGWLWRTPGTAWPPCRGGSTWIRGEARRMVPHSSRWIHISRVSCDQAYCRWRSQRGLFP